MERKYLCTFLVSGSNGGVAASDVGVRRLGVTVRRVFSPAAGSHCRRGHGQGSAAETHDPDQWLPPIIVPVQQRRTIRRRSQHGFNRLQY